MRSRHQEGDVSLTGDVPAGSPAWRDGFDVEAGEATGVEPEDVVEQRALEQVALERPDHSFEPDDDASVSSPVDALEPVVGPRP